MEQRVVEGQQVVPRAQSLTDALPFAPRSEAALSASPNALWALNLAIVTDYELYQKTNNSAPMTMRVHHELRDPSKEIMVCTMPRMSTPTRVPAT